MKEEEEEEEEEEVSWVPAIVPTAYCYENPNSLKNVPVDWSWRLNLLKKGFLRYRYSFLLQIFIHIKLSY